MRLTLDIEQMRNCMDLWQHTLAIRDAHGGNRATELTRLIGTVGGWLDLLRLCSAEGADHQALQEITEELMQFQAWAEEARMALGLMDDATLIPRAFRSPR